MTAPAGRNDPCPCGSGRKYKKCCAVTDKASVRDAGKRQALEAVLGRFFESHPRPAEQKRLSAWKASLSPVQQAPYGAEKTDSIDGDTFYFGQEAEIWNDFVLREAQDTRNAGIADILAGWSDPRFAALRIVPGAMAGSTANPDLSGVPRSTSHASGAGVQALELLTGEALRLDTDAAFRPAAGSVVLGFWIPGLAPGGALSALNSLVLIEDPEDEPVQKLDKLFQESGCGTAADFYRSHIAAVYSTLGEGETASGTASTPEAMPEAVMEAIRMLESFLIENDLKHDRLMDVVFRFLKRKREKPGAGTAAAAAVLAGLEQGWLPPAWNPDDIAAVFGADRDEVRRLAHDMLLFERRTSLYREEEETVAFRVGADPQGDEFRQWQLYMHLKDQEVQGEAALRRQMDYYSRIPYNPATQGEEAQLRAYEAYLARNQAFRLEKLEEARKLDSDNADVLLLAAGTAEEPSARLALLERAEQSAFRHFEADISPVWLHMPNRPYLRALMIRAVHDWESGQHKQAFERFYRLLQLNPADHQGARYPAISALIASGGFDAASGLLAHYADGSGDNAFYRWFEWAIAHRKSPLATSTEALYRTALEANPYAGKYVKSRPEADRYPLSAAITPRSPEEARLIWTLLRPALNQLHNDLGKLS